MPGAEIFWRISQTKINDTIAVESGRLHAVLSIFDSHQGGVVVVFQDLGDFAVPRFCVPVPKNGPRPPRQLLADEGENGLCSLRRKTTDRPVG